MTPLPLYHGPFGLEVDAICYTVFCAIASFLITCVAASHVPLRRRFACCLSAWSRVLGGAFALYVIKLLDERNGDVSIAYALLFAIAGGWLVTRDLKVLECTRRRTRMEILSAALLLVASCLALTAIAPQLRAA